MIHSILVTCAMTAIEYLRIFSEIAIQYILGFGTWYGLSTIGEPPLTKSLPCDNAEGSRPSEYSMGRGTTQEEPLDPMPAWLIFLFFALVASRYVFSFLFSYVYQVIATVVMVSSEDISSIDAARGRRRPGVRPAPPIKSRSPDSPKKPPKKTPTFQPKFFTKQQRSLTRSLTMPIETLGRRFFKLPFLRGLNAFLIMSVAQWYLGAVSDFFLSGQPKELMPGYGSSSVMLAVFFGGGSALWTHYAITEPSSNRELYDLFPRGKDLLVELFPITCLWAACEQITNSLPLALSRSHFFNLRPYAWTPSAWNALSPQEQRLLLAKFATVYLLYLLLVATFSIPASMTIRRIHASMLPDANTAIVPYAQGKPPPRDDDDESPTQRPGLTVGEAWATLTWSAYFRVVRVFAQYFLVNQLMRLLCWEAHRRLHAFFRTERYASPFPAGPEDLVIRLFG